MMDSLQSSICTFWFEDCLESPELAVTRVLLWFTGGEELDEKIRAEFADLPDRASRGEFDGWMSDPRGALALTLILDQFPRNLYRGTARAFEFDTRALEVALDAIGRGWDDALHPIEAIFFYLPMEHSERLDLQERSVAAFEALEARTSDALRPLLEQCSGYARSHRDVIRRFGRFPHRNAMLGRESRPEELVYLAAGGGFG
jgi:uncharacterized protein (DUF924 family)